MADGATDGGPTEIHFYSIPFSFSYKKVYTTREKYMNEYDFYIQKCDVYTHDCSF
jgi:hypothetical protein